MKSIYKFIAGNSRVTPVGIAVAVGAVLLLGVRAFSWSPALYLVILLITLAAATFEPVQ